MRIHGRGRGHGHGRWGTTSRMCGRGAASGCGVGGAESCGGGDGSGGDGDGDFGGEDASSRPSPSQSQSTRRRRGWSPDWCCVRILGLQSGRVRAASGFYDAGVVRLGSRFVGGAVAASVLDWGSSLLVAIEGRALPLLVDGVVSLGIVGKAGSRKVVVMAVVVIANEQSTMEAAYSCKEISSDMGSAAGWREVHGRLGCPCSSRELPSLFVSCQYSRFCGFTRCCSEGMFSRHSGHNK